MDAIYPNGIRSVLVATRLHYASLNQEKQIENKNIFSNIVNLWYSRTN